MPIRFAQTIRTYGHYRVHVSRQCRRLSRHTSIGSKKTATSESQAAQNNHNMEKKPEKSGSGGQCVHIKSDQIHKGKWIALSQITYKDPIGRERTWELVERTHRQGSETDAVVIIPILKRMLKCDCVILVKQYRPPLRCYSVEFPAGLIDKDEDPLVCAVRELKEETGYTGIPKHSSPGLCLDPGLSNSTVNMVTVEIDGDEECNRRPAPQPDEGEFIEVIPVRMDSLLETLNEYASNGMTVHSIVYTYAIASAQMAKPKKIVPR